MWIGARIRWKQNLDFNFFYDFLLFVLGVSYWMEYKLNNLMNWFFRVNLDGIQSNCKIMCQLTLGIHLIAT